MKTRKQEYAAKIFKQVSRVKQEYQQEYHKKYGSLSHRLPVLVRAAGLAQALAFVEARGKDPGQQLLRDIAEVVGAESKEELLKRSREAELLEYVDLTRRVLAALDWYRRFAQSVLKVEAGEDGKEVRE
ncbi:type III-B CRISPR module-associated protein Cmr5 [Desulfothermobacter acidiphilus]|uniref:type III-B CRISPR module-associated protein Cmr5 n=1 Tax=Desulfothermobacter acidiphilus TaxID=1938353 RepID=UPI003F8BFCF1